MSGQAGMDADRAGLAGTGIGWIAGALAASQKVGLSVFRHGAGPLGKRVTSGHG